MNSDEKNENNEDTNIEHSNKITDLIDEIEEVEAEDKNKEKENENNISNGISEPADNGEEHTNGKPKLKKYAPKNEQEALKARIINLEIKEKPHDQLKESYDFHMHENLDTNVPGQIEKFRIPRELKKTFIIVMILATLGVALIICGFIKAISDATPGGGIMFWVLGTVVLIPGGFYSYQFYKAKKAKEEYRRQDILDNIPQL